MAQRSEALKSGLVFTGVGLLIVIPILLAIYVPVWNHNVFGFGLVAALVGTVFGLNFLKRGLNRALIAVAAHLVFAVGVWHHSWIIMGIMLTIAVVRAVLAFRKKLATVPE